jgi:hypothetical protein
MSMRVRVVAALLIAGSLAGVAPAIAQPEACPASAVCYEGHELEFDAADGPVQFLVVATTVRTTTTLDGQTTSETATLVAFASDGDRFSQRGDPLTYPKTGVLATADVGDTFVLTEAKE